MRTNVVLRRAVVLTLSWLAAAAAPVAQIRQVTEADKAEIQALVAGYARALSGCAAADFASLFAPGSGYFASGFRGQIAGRDRLIALVQSERHCFAPAAAAAAPRPGGAAPTVVVQATATGVRGTVDLGGSGEYDDEYVKLPAGWRFASRHVITPAEKKAGLSARDMIEIRQLAGGPDDFGDLYPAGADGVKRLRSSGVALGVSADGITGRAALKDGSGFYDDVYVKADGRWRFKSRVFTPVAATAAQSSRPATGAATLTALDYVEIGQLVSKYARFIDTCSNNGYDYADLFAADGFFAPEQNGTIGRKFQGREQLAAVSGGGANGCKNVGWIVQGVKHMYVNHIITPSADGATGTVDMLMIGLDGDPFRIRHEGYYEDTYVKTAQGWRFKSRIHHVPQGGTVGSPRPAPAK